jgi:hypothetical protein
MTQLMFHVRHNAKPTLVREVLEILDENNTQSLDEILNIGRLRGCQIGTTVQSTQSLKENPIQTGRDLGLISSNNLSLTDLGRQMTQLFRYKPNAFNEVMHLLFYTLWNSNISAENCFSWSYRKTCDQLWENASHKIERGLLVTYVSETAMVQFATQKVSFSKDSVRGVLQWLAELEPHVLDGEKKSFTRRTFCPPEAFVLAVDYLYRTEGADYQTNLILDPKKQETICKVCLLEPAAFDSVLEWTVGQYNFIQRGTGGGWGSYLLLTKQPQVQDFLG